MSLNRKRKIIKIIDLKLNDISHLKKKKTIIYVNNDKTIDARKNNNFV